MKFEYTTTAYYNSIGLLCIRNSEQLKAECKKTDLKEFEVVFKSKSKHRSTQQNRWWWACINILSNELGYSKDQMHEICKYKFLKHELVDEKTGEVFEYLKSTTELTTTEFSTLIESLIQWSAETFNCVLPYPNEQTTLL